MQTASTASHAALESSSARLLANGTRARLLAESSRSGTRKKLQQKEDRIFVAQQLDLEGKQNTDFSVTV
eukprot:5875281-Karenia_brevis.AAC.1